MPLPHRLALVAAIALLWPLAPEAQTGGTSTFFPDTVPTVPEFVGVGGAAVAAPTQSPFAIFHNPALLADAGERPGLRLGTSLTPSLFDSGDLPLGTGVGSIGLRTAVGGRPLHVTLAGAYRELNVDADPTTDDPLEPTFDTEDRTYGGGLAVGWQGPVRVRVGAIALSREAQEQSSGPDGALDRDRAVTLDLGAAVTLPLIDGPAVNGIGPRFSLTFGAARQGIELQSDLFERPATGPVPGFPAPPPGLAPAETDRYGATADLAFVRRVGARGRLRVGRLRLSTEQRTAGAGSGHYGGAVTLAETVTVRGGVERLDVGVETETRTSAGLGVSLDGLIRAIAVLGRNPRVMAVADRLTFRGDVARYDIDGPVETDYFSFTVGWRP